MDEVPKGDPGGGESLRERKKRLTRRLITDTATAMFLERGFDDVKVAEIAGACGVSEKTVYNYFPTKESLLLDREAEVAEGIWRALGPGSPVRSPVEGMLELLAEHLDEIHHNWVTEGMSIVKRFGELIEATPSLRAAEQDMSDRLSRTAAEAMAALAGVSPDDPEPQIAAMALLGLWRIQFKAIRRLAGEDLAPDEARRVVTDEVQRAARLVESGLWSFGAIVEGRGSREQFKAAADAAQLAGRQVAAAVRQAKAAWQQLQQEHQHDHHSGDPHEQPFQGFAALFEQKEQWVRERRDSKDQWKQAYREQQAILRQAQRELQHRFRQAAIQPLPGDPRGAARPGPRGGGRGASRGGQRGAGGWEGAERDARSMRDPSDQV